MASKKRPDLRSAMGRLTEPNTARPGHEPSRPSGGPRSPQGVDDKAPQYGRNRDPNYQQLNFNVPVGLRRRFKAKLEAEGQLMQDVLEDAIRAYVGDFLEELPDFPSGRQDR